MSVAVITGGSSGIGAATAAALRARGDDVLVADLNPPPEGGPYVKTDVTDLAQVQAAFDEAEKQFGRVDYAVLCAGLAISMGSTPETIPWDTYQLQLGVNVNGIMASIRSATPAMRRAGGGAIVAMSSLAGIAPSPGDPIYSLTKFAVLGLIRSLAPLLAPDNVRINAMCPGYVNTPMVDELRQYFGDDDFPLIDPSVVVGQILHALGPDGGSGQAYLIQAGHEPAPYKFRGVPGAKTPDGRVVAVPEALARGEAVQHGRG
jgi:NAD(P)-dependent dehydrogenase (short-subunit alcohol dehydrogenase family)